MSADPFFLVWSPTGSAPPSRRHETEESAVRKAERLAETAPQAEFFVLRAVSVSKKSTVRTVPLDGNGTTDTPNAD